MNTDLFSRTLRRITRLIIGTLLVNSTLIAASTGDVGTHSNKTGDAMTPEMLRWLWRDYPRPDDPMDDSNRKLFVPSVSPEPEK
jgi:hypothetical protein